MSFFFVGEVTTGRSPVRTSAEVAGPARWRLEDLLGLLARQGAVVVVVCHVRPGWPPLRLTGGLGFWGFQRGVRD